MLELDHIFCFCDPELEEVSFVERLGFNVGRIGRHPGQGTANRSLMFQKNYLEFIFLENRDDAIKNEMKLHLRSDWQTTGYCPFGIGLRGVIEKSDREKFWKYRPPYWPDGTIFVLEECSKNPSLPVIFVVEPEVGQSLNEMMPIHRLKNNPELMRHRSSSTLIKHVSISGPKMEWPLEEKLAQIKLQDAPDFNMEITLDGKLPESRIHIQKWLHLN